MARRHDSDSSNGYRRLSGQMDYIEGYDYKCVDPASADDLICLICHHLSRDAQQTACCGQTFCKMCLERFKNTRNIDTACPHCRVETFDFGLDKKSQRRIYNLVVYCTNEEVGCTWTGEVRSVKDHLENVCPFTELQCSNQCGLAIQRRLLEDHLTSHCRLRRMESTGARACCSVQKLQVGDCVDVTTLNSYKQLFEESQVKLKVKEKELEEMRESIAKADIECKKKLAAFHALDWGAQMNGLAAEKSPGLPTVIKICNFVISDPNEWVSPPFTTDGKGYRLCMKVFPNGYPHNDGYMKYVSVALYLMRGEHDEELRWPMKGVVKVHLLNQFQDQDHSELVVFQFNGHDNNLCCKRVTDGSCSKKAVWSHKFIAHDKLDFDSHRKHQYLKDRCICFRVMSFSCL